MTLWSTGFKLELIIFTSNDGVLWSARIKLAQLELNWTVSKFATVLYDGISEIENRAGDVGPISNQQQEPSDSKNKLLKIKNLSICQNSKMVKNEIFYNSG